MGGASDVMWRLLIASALYTLLCSCLLPCGLLVTNFDRTYLSNLVYPNIKPGRHS